MQKFKSLRLIIKLIIEKITTLLNNEQFLSNDHIPTKFFSDSGNQLTEIVEK